MANRSQGPDWAVYQGANGIWGTSADQFAICQIGGTAGGRIYWQSTYASQIRGILAKGRRAHAYIWFQVGGSQSIAKACLDAMLPKLGLPKGAIVALDYEDGASASIAANTSAILYGMRRIKAAGYTPMYYSYKPYTLAHVDYKAIVREFGTCIWLASYPLINATTTPAFDYFPSLDGVAIWQFTNKYGRERGLDGNVDLTGITLNGYRKAAKPKPAAPKPKKKEDDMPELKYYPATTVGIAYARKNAVTYDDLAMTKKKGALKKAVCYKAFEVKDGAVDVGTQWVSTQDVFLALNPLVEGHKAVVRNVKPVVMSTGKTVQPGKWKAFGVTKDKINLGGGQTADASLFEIEL